MFKDASKFSTKQMKKKKRRSSSIFIVSDDNSLKCERQGDVAALASKICANIIYLLSGPLPKKSTWP